MPNVSLHEERLILLDEVDDVSARNVAVVDDGEAGEIEVEFDRPHASSRNRGSNCSAVEHSGENQIVRIERAAGGFPDSVLSSNVVADCWHERR
jgi:hypothetical protein